MHSPSCISGSGGSSSHSTLTPVNLPAGNAPRLTARGAPSKRVRSICRLSCDDEPFACPEKYRHTYMSLHLDKIHGLGDVTLLPQNRGKSTVWAMGHGGAQPVLRAVEVEV